MLYVLNLTNDKNKWHEYIKQLLGNIGLFKMEESPILNDNDQFLVFLDDDYEDFTIKRIENKANIFFFVLSENENKINDLFFAMENFGGYLYPNIKSQNPKTQVQLVYKYFENDVNLKDYAQLEKELEHQYIQAKENKERLKQIYRRLVPLRKEEYKNVHFVSKFQAGLGNDSEFFNYIGLENKVVLFLVGSSSSGIIKFLDLVENLNRDIEREELAVWKKKFHTTLLEEEMNWIFLEIELATLEVKLDRRGDQEIFLIDRFLKSNSEYNFFLRPGQRLILFSNGLVQNLGDREDFKALVMRDNGLVDEDLFDECFIMLKGNKKFLDYDATMLKIKVGENALFKV